MRILAVDYGDARTGLAVSDPSGLICGDAWTIREARAETVAKIVAEEAEARGAAKIILGLPKNMNGTEGPRSEKSRALKTLVESRCAIPVILWDERLTTVSAHTILRESGKKTKKHKGVVDAVAASLILEGYLGAGR